MSALSLPLELGDLAQAAAAFEEGQSGQLAIFEFSILASPAESNYLVFAGLATLINQLQNFQLSPSIIDYLQYHSSFAGISLGWLEHLRQLKFKGDVWSMAEGSIFFAPSPVLRITAPFEVGVLLSSMVTGVLAHQIHVATGVSRLLAAAEGRQLIDVAVGNTANSELADTTTRAAYLAGIVSTTNLAAAQRWQLPSQVLMTHVWPMFIPDEVEAFHRFGRHFMTSCIPVVDTIDALASVKHAIASGAPLQAIRLESGDLFHLSVEARRLLDQNGRRRVKIIAGGHLDEDKISRLISHQAPIDVFAISNAMMQTSVNVNRFVYKLVAVQTCTGNWEPVSSLSSGSRSYPWPKQVYRTAGDDGTYIHDVIAWEREMLVGEKLLQPIMKQGELINKLPGIEQCRDYCMMQRIRVPAELLALSPVKHKYPIRYSAALEQEMTRLLRLRPVH